MRRPLAVYGFSFLACGFCFFIFGDSFLPWAGGITAVLSIVVTVIRTPRPKNRVLSSLQGCCLALLCGCVVLGATVGMNLQPLESYRDTPKTLTMTVVEQGVQYETSGYYTVTAKGLYTNPKKTARIRLLVSAPATYETGDVLQGNVLLTAVDVKSEANLLSNGILLTARENKDTSLTKIGTQKSFRTYTERARKGLLRFVNGRLSGETAAMVTGICLGDTAALSPRTVKQFGRTGMSHMVAVSGLHTGMVSSLLVATFAFVFPKRKRLAKVLSVGLVWFFICMAQLPFSACRAGIMFTLFALCSLFYRMPDLLNTLGGAVLLVLAVDPLAAGNVGFLASIGACLGIVLLATPLTNAVTRRLPERVKDNGIFRFIINCTAVTLSATVGTLPCSFLYFYQISWIAPLVNLPGIPLAALVLTAGAVSALLSLIPFLGLVADLVLAVGGACANLLLKLADVFGNEGTGGVPFVSFWCWLVSVSALTGAIFLYKSRRRLRPTFRRVLALGLVVLFAVGLWLPATFERYNQLLLLGDEVDGSVVFLQGDKAAVVGCARPYTVAQALSSSGVDRITWLIVLENAPFNTDLKTLLCLVRVQHIMVTRSTLEKGVLTGLDGLYESVVFLGEISLGTMTLTVEQDLNRVVCKANGVTVGYNYGASESPAAQDITVTHPVAEPNRGFALHRNGCKGYVKSNTVIVWRKGTPRLYSSAFM